MTLKLTLKAPLSEEQKEKLLRKVGVIQDPPDPSRKKLLAQEKAAQKAFRSEEQLKKKEEQRIAQEARIHELKIIKKKRRWAAVEWLHGQFPAHFTLKAAKPLQMNIGPQIIAWFKEAQKKDSSIPYSLCDIRHAISYYAFSLPYFEAMVTLRQRYDLQGNPVEDISEKEIAYAQSQIDYVKLHGKPFYSPGKKER